jgi:hypothetical protein
MNDSASLTPPPATASHAEIRDFYIKKYGFDMDAPQPPQPPFVSAPRNPHVGEYRLATDGVSYRVEQLQLPIEYNGPVCSDGTADPRWVGVTPEIRDRNAAFASLQKHVREHEENKKRGPWRPVEEPVPDTRNVLEYANDILASHRPGSKARGVLHGSEPLSANILCDDGTFFSVSGKTATLLLSRLASHLPDDRPSTSGFQALPDDSQ